MRLLVRAAARLHVRRLLGRFFSGAFSRALLLTGALSFAGAALSGRASASSPQVFLVRPGGGDPAIAEALVRIRGELVADGFEVVVLDDRPPAGPTAGGDADLASGSSAVVELSLDPDAHAAEFVLIDRLTNKTLTRRIDTRGERPGHIAQVLAVRAVELLRASLLELLIVPRGPVERAAPPPSEARQKASRWAEAPLIPEVSPSRIGIEFGACVVASPSGVGPAVLSVGRVSFAPRSVLHGRLAFAGLGTSPRIMSSQGSATVEQRLLLGDVVLLPWREQRGRPYFSLGAGTLQVEVDGQAAWPYRGTQSSRWAFAGDAGAGIALPLGPRFDVSIEAHALFAAPAPVIRFVDVEVARVAQPALMASVTLVGWL